MKFIAGLFIASLLWGIFLGGGFFYMNRQKNFENQEFYETNWRQKQEIRKLWTQRNTAWMELNRIRVMQRRKNDRKTAHNHRPE